MNYTPFAHLTDAEFITHLSCKVDPTDEEVEAMVRLEVVTEDNDDLAARCATARATSAALDARSRRLRERSAAAMARSADLFGRGV